jgi:predicted enzyme related to lactoylglutathione lyase
MTEPVHELRLVLTVEDFDEALRFYRDALGLRERPTPPFPGGRLAILEAGRATLELVDEVQAAGIDEVEVGRRVAGPVRVAFGVPDADEALARLAAVGATVVGEPRAMPWGSRNARVEGPQGMQLTLFSGE